MSIARIETSARSRLRPCIPVPAMTLLAVLLLGFGCRKEPEPEPVQEEGPPPPPPRGIYHGRWKDGDTLFYIIDHQLKTPPIITVVSNGVYRAELSNVEFFARKLTFEQTEFPCISTDDDIIRGEPPRYASTGEVWNVVMRVAINDPHRVLCEKTSASAEVVRMLWRDLSAAGQAWHMYGATNAGPTLLQDLLSTGQVTTTTQPSENPSE